MAEIQNALAAGKEVTVHQAPITQSGWTGSGYIITDPATGAGAYMIAGGANGAWIAALLFALFMGIVAVVAALPFILIAATLGLAAISIVAAASLALAYISVKINMPKDSSWRTFFSDLFGGVSGAILVGVLTGLSFPIVIVAIVATLINAIIDSFILAKVFYFGYERRIYA